MKYKDIIDGVDVSGCRYYSAKYKFNGCGHICKGTECEYKRLWLKKQLVCKTAECEKLKKEKAEIKKYLGIDSKTILERLEELQERRDELSEKNISYEQALDSIVATIKDLENENIVTFPDFSLKENCKIIMGQCNKGYVDILNIIAKAKGN